MAMRASAPRPAPRRTLRRGILLSGLLLATPLLAGPASADVVENNFVAQQGNDSVLLGEALAVAYHVRATGNDRQAGCNAADGTPATLAILPSSPRVRATPASLTFTACDAPQVVLLVGDAPGNYRVNLAVHDANAAGGYDVNGAEFTLHVLAPVVTDATGPALAITPPAGPVEATSAAGAVVAFGFSASDPSGVAAASCSPASGAVFPLGDTTVTCSATDALGNPSQTTFVVTVADTRAPTLTLPADLTLEATGPDGAVGTFDAAASDAVDAAPALACVPPSGATFPLGGTTVACEATDASGNAAQGSFLVLVQDTTPPILALPPDLTLEATGPGGAAAWFSATAWDLVDGARPVACGHEPGDTFALGWTVLACSAMDARGNAAHGSFTIHVRDTTPPALAAPADVWAGATSGAGAGVPLRVLATDLVDGDVLADCAPGDGHLFPLGNTTVECTATDAAGNAAPPVRFTVGVHFLCEGPLAPLKPEGRSNVKLGSTVPIKCRPYGASAGAGDAILRISLRQLNAAAPAGDLLATSTSAADSGNVMRWDPVAQQYIYNLGTRSLAKGTWQVTMDLGGGDQRTFLLGLR